MGCRAPWPRRPTWSSEGGLAGVRVGRDAQLDPHTKLDPPPSELASSPPAPRLPLQRRGAAAPGAAGRRQARRALAPVCVQGRQAAARPAARAPVGGWRHEWAWGRQLCCRRRAGGAAWEHGHALSLPARCSPPHTLNPAAACPPLLTPTLTGLLITTPPPASPRQALLLPVWARAAGGRHPHRPPLLLQAARGATVQVSGGVADVAVGQGGRGARTKQQWELHSGASGLS